MSFLNDLFGGANNAASAQTSAMLLGLGAAGNNANQANQDLTSATQAGVAPFQANLATANQGVGALGNALGLNGAAGNQSALAQLATTPGYQFTLGQGNNAINAAAAAKGMLNSGNQATALANYDSGLAQNTYSNYVSQLQPYLGASQAAASGIGGMYQNLGNQQASVQNNLTNAEMPLFGEIGNAQASADLANQGLGLNLLGGGLKGLGGLLSSPTSGTIGSSLLGGLGAIFSDERLKEDIEPVGELYDGQEIYRYKYKGDDTMRIGVMAQEVAERIPDAVIDVGGFLAVNYEAATDYAAEIGGLLEAPRNGAPATADDSSYAEIMSILAQSSAMSSPSPVAWGSF
jgi:hypothetical protein